jgi:hypothetical protein
MKLNIVKDTGGKVVATFENSTNGVSLRPVLQKGHTLHQVDAPENYRADIKGFYERHSK